MREPTVVLYTAVSGRYDDVPPVKLADPSISAVAFVDAETAASSDLPEPWIPRKLFGTSVPFHHPYAPRLRAKEPKIRPAVLGDLYTSADVTIWSDASIAGWTDYHVLRLVRELDQADVDLLVFRHPCTRSVRDEVDAVRALNLDEPKRLDEVLAAGLLGMDRFVCACGVIVRRNPLRWQDGDPIRFAELWWRFLVDVSSRDQLSFHHFAIAADVRFAELPFTMDEFGLDVRPHNRRRP